MKDSKTEWHRRPGDVRSVQIGVVLAMFSLIVDSGSAQDASPRAPAMSEIVSGPVAARIDSFLSRLCGFDYDGSILVAVKGEVILRKAYGYADRCTGRACTTDDVFDIGSLAKQFTAAAVLKLEEFGSLQLDDPLSLFFPDAPEDKKDITIEQLLTHTAGLASDFPVSDPSRPDFDDVDRNTAVQRILAQPLDFPPGKGWSYSNCGFVLLAAVVQKAAEMDFREFVREELFTPAGMQHTGFWGTPPPVETSVALGHDAFGNLVHDPAHMPATWFDLGGGEVWTTLDDLRAWILALKDSKVLDGDAVDRLFEPRTGEVSARDGRYAYGWFVQKTPRGTRQLHHGGDYLGTGAWLRWFADDDVLAITCTAVRHDLYPTQNVLQRELPKLLFEDAKAPPVPAFTRLDAEPPAGLEGTYSLESGGRFVLRRIHGRLYVGAEGQDATDALAGESAALEADRAWCSMAGLAAIDGAMRHERAPLEAVLGPNPNPDFAGLLEEEVGKLAREHGGLRRLVLLGTFATGYPHGNPPSRETTLIRIEGNAGDVVLAIRWNGRAIAFTEVVAMPLACCVPLQLEAQGVWIGWRILEARALRLRVLSSGDAPDVQVENAGSTYPARRL